MTPSLQSLNAQFAIPNAARIIAGQGGLPCIDIATPACTGQIYLHGAHVTAWQPAGRKPVLFLSQKSVFAPQTAIRGGVPICFPWFGPHPSNPAMPAHGFARLANWQLESLQMNPAHEVAVILSLHSNPDTLKLWPENFALRHRVTFGRQLIMKLETANPNVHPLTFEQALHTYLAVGDVRQARVTGCENIPYLDKTNAMKQKFDPGPLAITAETDRIYLNTQEENILEDPVLRRHIRVHKYGSQNTVIWNPWITKAKAMSDFGDNEWPTMLCIETCNVRPTPLTLPAKATREMTAIISIETN